MCVCVYMCVYVCVYVSVLVSFCVCPLGLSNCHNSDSLGL